MTKKLRVKIPYSLFYPALQRQLLIQIQETKLKKWSSGELLANKVSVLFSFPHLDSAHCCISTLLSQDPKLYLGLLFKQNKSVSSSFFFPSP